jgi:hypothetical protein
VVSQGAKGISRLGAGDAAAAGAEGVGADISAKQLKQMLTYPADWGPTEWVSTCRQASRHQEHSKLHRMLQQQLSRIGFLMAGTHPIPAHA